MTKQNNKNFDAMHIAIQPAGGGLTEPTYYCFSCKKYWNATGFGAGDFRTHLRDDHGFVDVG